MKASSMTRREALRSISAMVGATVSLPLVSAVMAGCRAESTGETYALQTLTRNQHELVGALAEVIIPETDTPGARAAGVPDFIDRMLTDWYPEDDRTRFLAGLDRLDTRAATTCGDAFVACTTDERTALVAAMDREAFQGTGAAKEDDPVTDEGDVDAGRSEDATTDLRPDDTSFYKMLKELTVVGYYTSEAGATQELQVMPMGPFQADVPYAEIGHAWA